MSGQIPLVTVAPTPLRGDRQRACWAYIQANGGCTPDELGRHWHALKGKHGPETECAYCWEEGLSVLRSKALRPLVIRRRTGLWEPREKADRTVDRGAQLDGLPDWLEG